MRDDSSTITRLQGRSDGTVSMLDRKVSGMANRLCWKCGNKTHMTRVSRPQMVRSHNLPEADPTVVAAYTCDECGWLSIAAGGFAPATRNAALPEQWLDNRDPSWFPVTGERVEYPDVPAHISAAASEAHLCHSVEAYRAAVLLARSVIEATAKEKGITSGRLVTKIDAMHKQELIRRIVKDGAHEVRLMGNDMAHGDFVDPITEEEAEEVLELMAEVLHDVFQQDARVSRRRAAREAKKAGQTDA